MSLMPNKNEKDIDIITAEFNIINFNHVTIKTMYGDKTLALSVT